MIRHLASGCILILLFSCTAQTLSDNSPLVAVSEENETIARDEATVTAVAVSGAADGYTFSVTIESPDIGCTQYANWWEVVTEDGALLYRRILAHSHVEEQPFTRSGGPVVVDADDVLVVRSHMNTTGYSSEAMQGTISKGFEPVALPADFATELSEAAPKPGSCAF